VIGNDQNKSLRANIPSEALLLRVAGIVQQRELVARATAAIITAAAETASTAPAILASLGFVDV